MLAYFIKCYPTFIYFSCDRKRSWPISNCLHWKLYCSQTANNISDYCDQNNRWKKVTDILRFFRLQYVDKHLYYITLLCYNTYFFLVFSQPQFAALSNLNSTVLPANFVLKLAKPIPMATNLVKDIQNVTNASKLAYFFFTFF